MGEDAAARARELVDAVYRAASRRVLAALIRLLGDFDLAGEALHEAFRAALEQWPRDGVSANPRAWLAHVQQGPQLEPPRHAYDVTAGGTRRLAHRPQPRAARACRDASAQRTAAPPRDLRS
jgi:predicted RNA polymerase sigma factor